MKRGAVQIREGAIPKALESLTESSLSDLVNAIREESKTQGLLISAESGEEDPIPIAITPWVVSAEAARYLQVLFRGIRRTVNRILSHYFEDPKLQEILPLRESELSWLKASCPEGIPRLQTIFERVDTNLGTGVEKELHTFQIIEFNAVGVGCIYLMPAATYILDRHLLPRLKEAGLELPWALPADYRKLLLSELIGHAKAMGASECRVALVERRESTPGGVDEFARLVPFFEAQGVPAFVADPREVEHRDGNFSVKEKPIDVIYRDFQLEEVVSIKTHGGSVEGIEAAFADNRVVSTVFGEFDHKSLCELLTNPDFSHYFSPQEVRAARRRIPWTRLIDERSTEDLEGKKVDLIPYIRDNREKLVIKPNRGYGGEGVLVGGVSSEKEWNEALEKTVAKPKTWVVQEKVPIAKAPVMVLKPRGKPVLEEQFVTLSVTATSRGAAFVGRCSPDPVVNISQGGGLVPVFLLKSR